MENLCKASGTPILSVLMQTPAPLDQYIVRACGKGAHSVQRVRSEGSEKSLNCDFRTDVRIGNALVANGKEENVDVENFPPGSVDSKKMLAQVVQWFNLYFKKPESIDKSFPNSIQICVPDATEFQVKVWETLRDKVTFGNTISYGELAALVDKPNAARAVGSTMKKNPNCILVPCHRVIKTSAEIGNYNGGRDIKIWLLDHEKKSTTK